ncbi:uncharacterized protein [Dermacentor andersoni]|uniref:uncharacterized protein n=1 Tax=Dermacentor andersoni TaxID=34620 RepID=UPI00215526DB|nr:uncharacterized protein LOC126548596 [Dermacentor andersoni]XP_054919290.1 uncharacterized protein LOC126548596 [Dermacentor andersoni]
MSNCYSLYILSRTASCWQTGLGSSPGTTTGSAVHTRTQRALTRLYGLRSKRLLRPRASPAPGTTTTASTFPRQWRPAGRLDLSHRPALLLVLHSCFRLRWVPSTLLHIDSPFCAPKEITSGTSITRSMSNCYSFYIPSPVASCWQTELASSPCTTTGSALLFSTAVHKRTQRALARLYGLRSKRLLRPRASPVPGATTTASTFPRQWRPAGRLNLPPRPALLLVLHSCFQQRSSSVPSVPLHYSMVCAPKNYFGHEHRLFRERLLLLLHSLAGGVLLADWTCLIALHYYWFCTPVFDSGGCLARSCTSTLRSALRKRFLRAPASPVP